MTTDNDRIEWALDEQASDKDRAILRWRDMTLRVGIGGDVALYPHGVGLVEFPDLALLHNSMEQALGLVLGHFGERYAGRMET